MAEGQISVLEITGVSVGGSAEHVLLLSRELASAEFRVEIALWGGGPLDAELISAVDHVHFLGGGRAKAATAATAYAGGPWRFVRGFADLIRLIRSRRYDVVHTHTSVAGAIGRLAASLSRVPVRVHMIHSIPANDHSSQAARTLFGLSERMLRRLTTHHVAGSTPIARKAVEVKMACTSSTTVIPYSFDPLRHPPGEGNGDEFRASLGWTDDVVGVGLVGRLEEQKGVEYLLEATQLIRERCPQLRIVIVGDGSLRRSLETLSDGYGLQDIVSFTGWRSDVATVMAGIDVMAIPSRWEAFGIVNLEAMAASKPVVGFAVEGIPEVVEDGVTGLLAPPGDVRALAEAIAALVTDRERRLALGSAGLIRLRRQFLPIQMVSAHKTLFRRLVNPSPERAW